MEAPPSAHAEDKASAVLSAFAKLWSHFCRLVGVIGFQALVSRALVQAQSEVPWLKAVRVGADATLEGFREAAQQPAEAVLEGSTVLLAQLLELLVTFIGEALMLRLLRDVWPEARLDKTDFSAEEIS